eukprot:TRINITY_DN33582_c0_g1_i1.p1 TRINITY_DN33582_c0_g1~~TRINITY_DN33582_c0_g1_i1.p1  ORF type:complete len:191 (+),score=13.80 TRINITY_DN33582_c0_g1_i1:42-575(+)
MRYLYLDDLKKDDEVYDQLVHCKHNEECDSKPVTFLIVKRSTESTGLVLDDDCRIRAVVGGSPADRLGMKNYLMWKVQAANNCPVTGPEILSQFSRSNQIRLTLGKFPEARSFLSSSLPISAHSSSNSLCSRTSSMGRAPTSAPAAALPLTRKPSYCLIEVTKFKSKVKSTIKSGSL